MGLHCAVDLHGNNGFYGVVDEKGNRLLSKSLANSLDTVVTVLEPYRDRLEDGVIVESTFNWYWLRWRMG